MVMRILYIFSIFPSPHIWSNTKLGAAVSLLVIFTLPLVIGFEVSPNLHRSVSVVFVFHPPRVNFVRYC